jgi:hypothetical protein
MPGYALVCSRLHVQVVQRQGTCRELASLLEAGYIHLNHLHDGLPCSVCEVDTLHTQEK